MAISLELRTATHITSLWRGCSEPTTDTDRAWTDLASLSRAARVQHFDTMARLAELFRSSPAPAILDGAADIELLTTFAGDRINRAASGWYDRSHPWATKTFDQSASTGVNWFNAERRLVVRTGFPRAPIRQHGGILEALPFRTYRAPSALDPAHEVLHIDYSHDRRNGLLFSRFSHDEVVQVGPGVHLGIGLAGRRGRQIRGVLYFAMRERSHS